MALTQGHSVLPFKIIGRREPAAQAAVDHYVRNAPNLPLDQIQDVQMRPNHRGETFHTGGRPDDPNADPNLHVTVDIKMKNGMVYTQHVYPDGTGTRKHNNPMKNAPTAAEIQAQSHQSRGQFNGQNKYYNKHHSRLQPQSGRQVNHSASGSAPTGPSGRPAQYNSQYQPPSTNYSQHVSRLRGAPSYRPTSPSRLHDTRDKPGLDKNDSRTWRDKPAAGNSGWDFGED